MLTLKPPFCITSRLTPGFRIGGAEISLERVGTESGRDVFKWTVELDNGTAQRAEYTGSDLCSGVGGCDMAAAMETLLYFLCYAAEQYWSYVRNGKNGTGDDFAFPLPVCEWAYQNSEELGMLQFELSDSSELIAES